MIGAIASGISGYMLSMADDYDRQLVNRHQWLGISTAIVAAIFYFLHRRNVSFKLRQWTSVILFLLIILTGHLGGSLTHGSDYLSLSGIDKPEAIKQKPIPDVQQAVVYADIVQPILQSKCYSCHGRNKQKGGLRMDDSARLWKGGKDGIVLISGNADESEMIKRLLLARNHEDHMPPKEKPQLNEQQIAVLHWWISSGASLQKKVKDLEQTEKIKPILLSFQGTESEKKLLSDVPVDPVKKADEKAIRKLKERGVVVLPVSQNSNYLMASFVTADSITNRDIALLVPMQQQLVWLKLGNTGIGDSALAIISKFKNISRLQLDHTNITDDGMAYLPAMNNLQYLNLVGTKVTANGVLRLKNLKKLQSVYLYQTLIKSSEWNTLKNNFPASHIDTGGYAVPVFEGDTSELKLQKKS